MPKAKKPKLAKAQELLRQWGVLDRAASAGIPGAKEQRAKIAAEIVKLERR